MNDALQVITDKSLTYNQKLLELAKIAENQLSVIDINKKTEKYISAEVISDMYEGEAPYRPRYIIPDYTKFMQQGSEFLQLKPATNIWEATNNLLILYKHVPSITSYPVYLGNIDTLLEPFITDNNIEEVTQAIRLFLTHIDRTLTDAFCHANIGPKKTRAGQIILKCEKELDNATPNITMKISQETEDNFIIQGIDTALTTAKPSFANDPIFSKDLGKNYAIASCYNGLKIGGGSHTLVRFNLAKLAELVTDKNDFFENYLPDAITTMCQYMDQRIKFLVEKSGFFESSFLIEEGLISFDNFSAMFGLVGLAECVNKLSNAQQKEQKFGYSEEATAMGLEIIKKIDAAVSTHTNKHCPGSDNHFLLHAQVGLDSDCTTSPGCRIPIGDEPELYQQISVEAPFHKYFPSGIGNIYPFDKMASKNPKYIKDIMQGAFQKGMRYFSLYSSDADTVRITGYLVKRSEIEKLYQKKQVRNNSVMLGKKATENQQILQRRVFSDAARTHQ